MRKLRTPFTRSFKPWVAGLATVAMLFGSGPVWADDDKDGDELDQTMNRLFDQAFDELTERTPTELSRLGLKQFYDRWDDLSPEEAEARSLVWSRWAKLARRAVDVDDLEDETEISLKLFLEQADEEKAALKFLDYDYPVNQMFGLQAEIPAFLSNVHSIDSVSDAESYILRLERLPELFNELTKGMLRREKKGILPPVFVFDYVLSDVDNLLQGYPLTGTPAQPHPIYADFGDKVRALKLDPELEKDLLARGSAAITTSWAAAYQNLRKTLVEQRSRATTDDGVWKFPRGAEYYAFELARVTTTDLSAEEIHQLGLSEVARIHREMDAILKQVGFQGTLAEFFTFMRTDPRFLYSNDEAGRAAYLKDATEIIDTMKGSLDTFFLTKPKADLVVKQVEAFREESAGKAFYETPALDGSRPGIYYANLYDMKSMPNYQMEALAYHEGIPGHHMQLSIAQEMEDLPKFRRLGGYTAYIEGWGLYCEQLPKEHGFYKDPYSDFGRLSMELFRAVRLVVDTGIHQKRWTRQQGLEYYLANTPNDRRDCQKMVDRHIVMPGQATAYKIGMIEILRLRERAKSQLGAAFDLREFHDTILLHGAVPLKVLEELVDEYIEDKLDNDD